MSILVVDDERAVRDAYCRSLEQGSESAKNHKLQSLANQLFADTSERESEPLNPCGFGVEYFGQGLEAVNAVKQHRADGTPFKVAFIDVRMPPGIDGKETARRIREVDSDINLVIVTGYSDHDIAEITSVAGPADKIMYLKKPFAADEVKQMALSLAARWDRDKRQSRVLAEQNHEIETIAARAVEARFSDLLTGLPNHLAFQLEIEKRLQTNSAKLSLAVLYLDDFKSSNETYGNRVGDEILRTICTTLLDSCPKSAFVGRLGEDVFGILIEADPQSAGVICKSAVAACQKTVPIFDYLVKISVSASFIAYEDSAGATASEFLRFAQTSLKRAKLHCRGKVLVFEGKIKSEALYRHVITKDLAKALKDGEISVYYQPIVSRETSRIAGFEALLRWTSPRHGPVSPEVFIPIAEEGLLILGLGEFVMRRAISDSKNWPDQYVSINVSPRQLKDTDIQQLLLACADEARVPHRQIQVEVTETALFDDLDRSCQVLNSLQQLGFRIALDDFGTGYSNMSRIKNLALDCIKVDKSFVNDLGLHNNALAIVSSMTQLAHNLNLIVVAEGVETAKQLDILGTVGCAYIQGYLFGPAEPIEKANERIAQERSGQNRYPHLSAPKKAG